MAASRVTFQFPKDSIESLYQRIQDKEQTIANLDQKKVFKLYKWVIRNEPESELVKELRQYSFTPDQKAVIFQLENYQTPMPPQMGRLFKRDLSVRRRLIFEEEEKREKIECSIFKVGLVLAGTYVIYSVVVKPIFKQIGEFFQRDVDI